VALSSRSSHPPESGYKFFQSSYLSLGAPAGTPEGVRNKLEGAFAKVLQNPAIKEEFQKKLFATLGYQSGAEYAKYIREQHAYYKDFLKDTGSNQGQKGLAPQVASPGCRAFRKCQTVSVSSQEGPAEKNMIHIKGWTKI
jgi:hypothetical protein